jgi:hypothetical protein
MLAKKMVIFLSQTESTPEHFLERGEKRTGFSRLDFLSVSLLNNLYIMTLSSQITEGAHRIKHNIFSKRCNSTSISSCQLSTSNSKTDWWQLYLDCEDLDGKERTVQSHIQIVSPQVGYSWG